MINEERLRPMVKMAMFDKNEGQTCKPMIEYARADYISMQLMKSFIAGSIAFVLLMAMWMLYDVSRAMKVLNTAYFFDFVKAVAIQYVVFIVVYLIIAYVVAYIRYTTGRKKVKLYYKELKEIKRIYEREEKLKVPSQME